MADHETEQGAGDRIGHQPGVMRQEDDEQGGLRRRRHDIGPQRIEMAAGGDLRVSREQGPL